MQRSWSKSLSTRRGSTPANRPEGKGATRYPEVAAITATRTKQPTPKVVLKRTSTRKRLPFALVANLRASLLFSSLKYLVRCPREGPGQNYRKEAELVKYKQDAICPIQKLSE